tara:strand:+ start:4267 stop:4785 length:519 start_codon:yes stop_codon:yes gene_type:complete
MTPPQQPPTTNIAQALQDHLDDILVPILRAEMRCIIPEVPAETIRQMSQRRTRTDDDESGNVANERSDVSPQTGPSEEFLRRLRMRYAHTAPIEEDEVGVSVREGEKGYSSGRISGDGTVEEGEQGGGAADGVHGNGDEDGDSGGGGDDGVGSVTAQLPIASPNGTLQDDKD